MPQSGLDLNHYIRAFQQLHISRSRGAAPHKPILLLAVLDEIENGSITENRIFITPEMVSRFKEIWSVLVDSNVFVPSFALPFYHLDGKGNKHSDHFWHLSTFPGCEIAVTSSNSIRSFAALKSSVEYAYFDAALFDYLIQPEYRNILRITLLDKYFENAKSRYLGGRIIQGNYINGVEYKMLNEEPLQYKKEIQKADEEEIFVRNGIFKKLIPRIYNFSCCISGFRVESTTGIQMIDACHIVPFSESYDDTITNGISLCPNLHRAFDRGLISLDDNYKVLVSDAFLESDSNYSIRRFENKEIKLPENKKYLPSKEGLAKHRARWLSKFK